MFLTDAKVKNAKPKEGKPQKLADGGGLYLYISTTGAKSWRYDYRLLGKRKTYTIGPYPDVSSADARKEYASARALVEKNLDPGQHRKAETQRTIAATKNTFKAVALSFIEKSGQPEEVGGRCGFGSVARRQPPYISSRCAAVSPLMQYPRGWCNCISI